MKTVENKIKSIIRHAGPISIAEFMTITLTATQKSFYTDQQNNPFGSKGHFTTAPEISQIFGELLAALAIYYHTQGSYEETILAEPGYGLGTMIKDITRTIKALKPSFLNQAEIILADVQSRIDLTQDLMSAKTTLDLFNLPPKPLFLFANEFLDALPIKQFTFKENKWHEIVVSCNNNDNLELALTTPSSTIQLKTNSDAPKENDVLEIRPAAISFVEHIAEHIKQHRGMAIIADYGYTEPIKHGTLSAIKHHKKCSILENIGNADISAWVNFEELEDIAKAKQLYCTTYNQGVLLQKLGIRERASALINSTNNKNIQNEITTAVERLVSPAQMGELFKVMIISSEKIEI